MGIYKSFQYCFSSIVKVYNTRQCPILLLKSPFWLFYNLFEVAKLRLHIDLIFRISFISALLKNICPMGFNLLYNGPVSFLSLWYTFKHNSKELKSLYFQTYQGNPWFFLTICSWSIILSLPIFLPKKSTYSLESSIFFLEIIIPFFKNSLNIMDKWS